MNDQVQRLDIGKTVSAAMTEIGRNIGRYGGLVAVLAVACGLADTYAERAGNVIGNIALFLLSVLAVFYMLQSRLGDQNIKPRFGAAFGFSLLSNLAIILGLVLLIVPGLMLLTRWALGLPALLREDLSVSEAMGRSSRLTEGNRWRILGLGLLIWVPFLIAMMAVGALTAVMAGEESLDTLPFNILINLAAGGATILSSLCWTEAYLTLSGDENKDALADIFA
jgi:hypothetical protein